MERKLRPRFIFQPFCPCRAAIKTRGAEAELNFPYESYQEDAFLREHLRLGREPFLKLMR
jgi:hypothetical protein